MPGPYRGARAAWTDLDAPVKVFGDLIHEVLAVTDPVETQRRDWDRVDYIHSRNIDLIVFGGATGRVPGGGICPAGHANIDFLTNCHLLNRLGYGGYIVIAPGRFLLTGLLLDDFIARRFLRGAGY